MSAFGQPDKGGEFFSPSDHPQWLGRLMLVYPDRVKTHTFKVDEGPVDLVEADVVILDLPDPATGQPTVIAGTTIGGKALVPNVKKRVGGMVLGRLSQAPRQGEKSGAYFLSDYTPQDEAVAMAYVQAHPRQQFRQPQAQAAPAPQAYAPPAVAPTLLPDPWANTGTYQPQVPGNVGPPMQAPPVAPAGPDPETVAFLAARGIDASQMSAAQALMIRQTFPA